MSISVQQGLHAKGGTQNEEQKRALRRRLHTEWCVIAKTKAILVMGVPIWNIWNKFEVLKYTP